MPISVNELAQKMSERPVTNFKNTGAIPLDQFVNLVRQHIIKNTTIQAMANYDPRKIREETHRQIDMYIDNTTYKVEEFDSLDLLRKEVKNIITDYDVLTDAMVDDGISEIQTNGHDQIWVERDGEFEIFKDKFDVPIVFKDKETYDKVVAKLNGDTMRLNEARPFISSRTVEGYRVAMTHPTVNPMREYTTVIRKQSKKKITATDILKKETIPKEALELLSYLVLAELSFFTVGETGSGKTILNSILIEHIPDNKRGLFIENPAEFRPHKHDSNGRIKNNVAQFIAVSPSDRDLESPDFPSMYNLITHSLRMTPKYLIPGEIRTGYEFKVCYRAAFTGHTVITTFHSDKGTRAYRRFLQSYMEESNEPAELVMQNICDLFRFCIVQEKLADGSRKVIEISEVVGATGYNPNINTIYEFVPDGKDRSGKILGSHKRINPISPETARKFLSKGIYPERVKYFLSKPNDDVCLYE